MIAKIKLLIILLLIVSSLSAHSALVATFEDLEPEGVLTPFWRGQVVTGNSLHKFELGIRPDYLNKTSFPDRSSRDGRLLFSDKLIFVRLLGGWHPSKVSKKMLPVQSMDLVYRDDSGQMVYRWDFLEARISPLVDAGYRDITLVLDNTPWAFTTFPQNGVYGQTVPPDNMQEWGAFIEQLCLKLIDLYGYDLVNNWRFRLGTEYQGRDRFYGTQEQYLQMYRITAGAIKKVLPGAAVGPFNQAKGIGNTRKNNIDYLDILRLSFNGSRNETVSSPVPVDFVSVSKYLVPNSKEVALVRQLKKKKKRRSGFFRKVASILPPTNTVPVEIHEFGVIKDLSGVRINAPGLYGTLIRYFMMFNSYNNPIVQLYHWNVLDSFKGRREAHHLLKGEGWLYSVLEYAEGGRLYTTSDVEIANKAAVKVFVVDTTDRVYVFAGALSDNYSSEDIILNITLPNNILNKLNLNKISELSYRDNTAVHNVIKNDLKTSGILKKQLFTTKYTSTVRQMGGNAAVKNVINHWDKYEKILIESLTLSKSTRIELMDGHTISLNICAPELAVFVIDKL